MPENKMVVSPYKYILHKPFNNGDVVRNAKLAAGDDQTEGDSDLSCSNRPHSHVAVIALARVSFVLDVINSSVLYVSLEESGDTKLPIL